MVAINIVGASRTYLFIAAQAPFAAFFAIAFTGEALRPLVVVGAVGVVIALMLAQRRLTDPRLAHRPPLLGGILGWAGVGGIHGRGHRSRQAVPRHLRLPSGDNLAQYAGSPHNPHTPMGAAAARNPAIREFDRKSLAFIVLCSLSTVTTITSQFFAVQRADVVVVAPLLVTFPLWTLLLSHIFIARLERITLQLIVGALLAVAGVIAVSLGGQL